MYKVFDRTYYLGRGIPIQEIKIKYILIKIKYKYLNLGTYNLNL